MKVNKFILIALVVTIFGCAYVYFFTGTKLTPPASPILSSLDAATVLARAKKNAPSSANRVPSPALHVKWDRDPFKLPNAFDQGLADLPETPMKLLAILSGKTGRVAVIGSEVVRKGDLIYGERVEEISLTGVVLTRRGSKKYLALGNNGNDDPVRNIGIRVSK